MVTMTIAATRIYRCLVEYASGRTEMYDMIPLPLFSALTVIDVVVARVDQEASKPVATRGRRAIELPPRPFRQIPR